MLRRGLIVVAAAALCCPAAASAHDDWRTLTAEVRRAPGPEGWLTLRCGGHEERTALPVTEEWIRITVADRGRHCKAGHRGAGEVRALELSRGRHELSIHGADVSSLDKSEDFGGVYRDARGRRGDALDILHDQGLDWIRLRTWVDPADGYHDTAELLRMARRAKREGLRVLVDFHYSDFWADPGKQWTPAAWEALSFDALQQTFAAYTRDTMRALVRQGTPPDMVQLGNEINPGLLWDYAATWTGCSSADDGMGGTATVCHTENWDDLARLLTTGYHAVKSVSPRTKVMLHLAEGGDNGTFRWWFDNVTTRGVPFDVIGASYYGYWHGTFAELQANLDDVTARYGKDVAVVETAYPFTLAGEDQEGQIIDLESELVAGYPATPEGQADWLRDIQTVVRAVPRALGTFWWEATWTAVPGNGWSPRNPASGNGWENQALFGFDDRLLPAAHELRE
jgi:arabinogalactan endo-1,4-beta-galactosidase